MTRPILHRYVDPLAQIWIEAARRIGLRVVRTADAYAATDGRGTLAIGTDDLLDADDSLAQMIFHELVHSLVEGEDAFAQPDWGMMNTGPDHDWREHACLRAQWVIAGRYGLRTVFAPTTDFRSSFWTTLAGDVLADRADRSVEAAIVALRRADKPPWAPAFADALAATARVAAEAAAFAARTPDTLWSAVTAPRALHPSGAAALGDAGDAGATCGTCAWRYTSRTGASARCRQVAIAARAPLDLAWPACERYEAALDCLTCGACCRAAYDAVHVSPRDPAVRKRPEMIVHRETYLELRRDGDRCAALAGGAVDDERRAPYHCTIYDDRPKTCRDFTLGGEHCLTARRRVGLSL